MKTITFLSFLVAVYLQVDSRSVVSQSQELPKALKDLMTQTAICGKELGPHKLRNLPTDIDRLTEYPEDNDSLNALWGCVFKKEGIIDDNSNVNQDKLQEHFKIIADTFDMLSNTAAKDTQVIHSIINECSCIRGDDSGQTAVKIEKCALRYFQKQIL